MRGGRAGSRRGREEEVEKRTEERKEEGGDPRVSFLAVLCIVGLDDDVEQLGGAITGMVLQLVGGVCGYKELVASVHLERIVLPHLHNQCTGGAVEDIEDLHALPRRLRVLHRLRSQLHSP